MPLRVRLALGFALGTGLLIAVVGLGFVLQLRASLYATLDVGLSSRASTLAEQYTAGGLPALQTNRDEEPMQVLTADGRVVASSPDLAGTSVLRARELSAVLARRVDGAGPLGFTAGDEDQRTRYLATVLSDRDGLVLVVGTGTEIADTADEHVDTGLLVLGPVAVVAAGLGAWWLSGAALRPVERMRRQSADLAHHDDGTHLAVPRTRDEIASLAATLNELLDRQRQALAQERQALERERGFVADAGHELRTPLATLRAELELAGRPGRDREELADAVASAAGETDRVIRLADDLLTLARADGTEGFLRRRPTDLSAVAAAAARAASAVGDVRDVDVVVESPPHLEAEVDPDRLRQALDNLLANALRHSPEHGVVTLTLTRTGGRAVFTVADDGPGFPEDFLPHAFERFRRADTARARADGGSGLGLSIVETITHAHRGRVRAANRPEGGAVVEIDLPVPGGAADVGTPGAVVSRSSPPD
ncbi:cell wall metabolism sensor histidine kinase WalK [Actinomycetospora sp. TBRC 11914]|uniref:sensor histidine kinase n=1 Tax=Actinomycetospora sp. TBRC 11914 TaxID=2729387 RepID=UPI00145CC166|nr:HAMP domain-containing sensor histidine kinase [Actinomycetospora sp. TBRC 11914]NMO92755.1 HAMP domain-containing histidine kinase [Actinomycetospora sp. TBRC 11914]